MLQSDFYAVIEILLNFILSSGFSAFRHLYNQLYITLITLLVFVENGEFKRYKTIRFWKMKKKMIVNQIDRFDKHAKYI